MQQGAHRDTAAAGPRSIAVVGAGISGLATAHLLARSHHVELFEREPRAGGHAHTHEIEHQGRQLRLDTGFLVYNPQTYPNFVRLLRELEVTGQPSDMSFGVHCRRCQVVYSSRGARGFLARPRQALSLRHWAMVRDIRRFNRAATAFLATAAPDCTVGEFLAAHGPFGAAFVGHYLLPMVGAIWSAPGASVRAFSTTALVTFLSNHGLLSMHEAPRWWTVAGGSQRYVEAITRGLGERVHLGTPVDGVRRDADGVDVRVEGRWRRFDHVVLATHADVSQRLLTDASPEEHAALGAFRYSANRAVLHTDRGVLPRERAAWGSWNSDLADCRDEDAPVAVTYHLNRLQSVPGRTEFCVSLNRRVRDEAVLAEMLYHHPIMDAAAQRGQAALRAFSGRRRTHFAGAHLGAGFHEDGLVSALTVARSFGVAA
jgi:predicted NAD/FAD-binding protein